MYSVDQSCLGPVTSLFATLVVLYFAQLMTPANIYCVSYAK